MTAVMATHLLAETETCPSAPNMHLLSNDRQTMVFQHLKKPLKLVG